jgi:hypothetical protein
MGGLYPCLLQPLTHNRPSSQSSCRLGGVRKMIVRESPSTRQVLPPHATSIQVFRGSLERRRTSSVFEFMLGRRDETFVMWQVSVFVPVAGSGFALRSSRVCLASSGYCGLWLSCSPWCRMHDRMHNGVAAPCESAKQERDVTRAATNNSSSIIIPSFHPPSRLNPHNHQPRSSVTVLQPVPPR